MKEKSRVLILQMLFAVAVLWVWETAGRLFSSVAFLVATPSQVGIAFWQLLAHEQLVWHFLVTGVEAVTGLVIGTLAGLGMGLSLWFSDKAAQISKPFVIVLGSLPIIAFAPLMIIWFGIGIEMKMALAAMSTFFISFNQAYRGISSVNMDYVDVLKGMNAPRMKIFFKAIIPGSMDWLFSSMRLNIGFGLLGAFIGEFISANQGLGYLILRASALYNVPRALAAAAGIAVLALLLDKLGSCIEQRRHTIVQFISVPRLIWR